jgi:chorismate mutase
MQKEHREVFLIAGPCSAESHEQMMQTAGQLANFCRPDVFRAGIWKSRTKGNTFEGIGKNALEWLTDVKTTYGFPVATEVMTPAHVELCLQHKIDYVWLGARTVVNPFMVSEICSALSGNQVYVMVKNPINPDVKLWVGAIERVKSSGIERVMAVHRGFSTYYNTPYRNMPLWEIPNELRRLMPEIPVICDPSHICGRSACLKDIMQLALDLEMNGLMIETHTNPQQALSDSEQQITPQHLQKLIADLIVRLPSDLQHQLLQNLRNEIDMIDDKLLENLARRMKIVEEIGKLKKEYHITILQAERSRHVFSDRMEKGDRLKMNRDFLKKILQAIHNEAIRIQFDILK